MNYETMERLLSEMRQVSVDLSRARSEKEYLSRFLPSKKAMLMSEAEHQYGLNTAVMQEAYALRHKEYIELLSAFKIAVEHEQFLYYQFKIMQSEIEMRRSISARQRFEFESYGANPAPLKNDAKPAWNVGGAEKVPCNTDGMIIYGRKFD